MMNANSVTAPAPTRFSIYRIVGNSLPPRHSAANNIKSVRYIIDNEQCFAESQRVWVINRMTEPGEKEQLIRLLEDRGEQYIDLPFDARSHFEQFLDPSGLPLTEKMAMPSIEARFEDPRIQPRLYEWILRHKSQHLVGVNAARNHALRLGRSHSEWTLVLDGGVMFTPAGWRDFVDAVTAAPDARFGVVPMRRIHDWGEVARVIEDASGGITTTGAAPEDAYEPQLAFHRQSEEIFDERLRYGNRNKAELLVRIGVPGLWNEWVPASWDVNTPLPAPNRGRFADAGAVIRLPTDGEGQEEDFARFQSRFKGVAKRSLDVDLRFALANRRKASEFTMEGGMFRKRQLEQLGQSAESMFAKPDLYITDKPYPAPGGSAHDYYTKAPYRSEDGTRHDGTVMTDMRHDRDALMQFITKSYLLAVSGRVLGRREFLEKASELVTSWFIDPRTRMNPDPRFAQVRPQDATPNDVGLIEFRGLILMPYTVKILASTGCLSNEARDQVRAWFQAFLKKAGGMLGRIVLRDNNLGTWGSALYCSSALFAGQFGNAFYFARGASIRLGKQLGPLCIQTAEFERTKPLHYSLFNLAGWLTMMRMCKMFGIHLDRFRGVRNEGIAEAISFCSANRERFADYAGDSARYDRWIAIMEKMKITEGQPSEIIINDDPDLGLPPVVFVRN